MPDDRLLQRVSSLAWLIETDARRLASDLHLEEALQRNWQICDCRFTCAGQFVTHFGDELEGHTLRLLREWWPALPGQTSEQLRRAIVALETWQKTVPGPEQEIEARYRWCEKLLALDPQTMREAQNLDHVLRRSKTLRVACAMDALGASPGQAAVELCHGAGPVAAQWVVEGSRLLRFDAQVCTMGRGLRPPCTCYPRRVG